MPYSRGQVILTTETLNIDPATTNLLPAGGFAQGDPIKRTGDTQGRECQVNTDIVAGFLINDQIFPFTKKTLEVVTSGDVEVTVSGAYPVDSIMILDVANPRRLIAATLDPSGTTYRQAVGRLITSTTAAGDKAMLKINFEMITI